MRTVAERASFDLQSGINFCESNLLGQGKRGVHLPQSVCQSLRIYRRRKWRGVRRGPISSPDIDRSIFFQMFSNSARRSGALGSVSASRTQRYAVEPLRGRRGAFRLMRRTRPPYSRSRSDFWRGRYVSYGSSIPDYLALRYKWRTIPRISEVERGANLSDRRA